MCFSLVLLGDNTEFRIEIEKEQLLVFRNQIHYPYPTMSHAKFLLLGIDVH